MENPIQYAVVREDPFIEKELVERHKPSHALLVGSGGCTAFTLATLFPELKLTLMDPNPAQLQLIQRKSQALQRLSMDPGIVNIGSEDPQGLNACGATETLLRCLRDFWRAFIIKPVDLEHMFDSEKRLRSATETLLSDPYWPVSFDLFFSDEMLTTMFGKQAFQHAPKGSYPKYFRELVERGLKRPDALENPFLHHMILGHYLETRREAWPLYLQRPPRDFQATYLEVAAKDVPSFTPFGLVHLSNIFDWMTDAQVKDLAQRLDEELPSGAVVIWRQLNNQAAFEEHFSRVKFDEAWGKELLAKERSLFYAGLKVGVKA
jgi:S-adenosylmethionine-diacylglycerol 3-amino-3-carboxypropyl transferase